MTLRAATGPHEGRGQVERVGRTERVEQQHASRTVSDLAARLDLGPGRGQPRDDRTGLILLRARQHLRQHMRNVGGDAVAKWRTVPLPVHPLFASQDRYPNAAMALDSSVIIGSQSYPLFAQPGEVVTRAAAEWHRLRRVRRRPGEFPRRRPAESA